MVESASPALNRSRETRAATQSGYLMLFVWLLLLGVAVWAAVTNANADVMVGWKSLGRNRFRRTRRLSASRRQRSMPWRAEARCHFVRSASSNTMASSAGAVTQSRRAISPSSWPGPQPA